jgi:hypothetical protein
MRMVDAQLAPARSAGSQVAVGGTGQDAGPRPRSRMIRYARLVAVAVGGFLLPWCAVLGATLPASAHVPHWWLAWVGLDGGEAAMAFATAALLTRSDVRASLTSAAGAALLLADAWFDICTSAKGVDQLLAIAEAAFAEVPLAIAAAWLAVRLLRGAGKPFTVPARLIVVINDPRTAGRSIRSALSGRAVIAGVAVSAIVAVSAVAAPAGASASVSAHHVTPGRIAGVVTGKKHPVQGLCVWATNVRDLVTYKAITTSTGHYTIHKAVPGRYYVQFRDCPKAKGSWLFQWYKGVTTSQTSPLQPPRGITTVRVKAGKTTTGINAAMVQASSISGQVTSAASGVGVPQICITGEGTGPNAIHLFTRTVKGGDGRYAFNGLFPAKYVLEYGCGWEGSANFAPQWWQDAATSAQATPINLARGQNVQANVRLTPGAVITGTVHSTSASGPPLPGICVTAAGRGVTYFNQAITASDGTYRLAGLATGTYQVIFDPFCGEPTSSFKGEKLTAQATAGHTTSGVNAFLQPKS